MTPRSPVLISTVAASPGASGTRRPSTHDPGLSKLDQDRKHKPLLLVLDGVATDVLVHAVVDHAVAGERIGLELDLDGLALVDETGVAVLDAGPDDQFAAARDRREGPILISASAS